MADGTAVEMTANDAYAELATDTIYNGIVIDGQDVGGMTKDEALAAVAAVQPEAPVSLNISLALDGETYPLDLAHSHLSQTCQISSTRLTVMQDLNLWMILKF